MLLVYPVLAQVLLTLVILMAMGRARAAALKAGQVGIGDVALSSERWPADVRKLSNNYANQFETPLLFFVLVGLAIYTAAAGWLMAVLAWIYVASRVAHAYVHTGSNDVMARFSVFLVGVAALVAMWIYLLIHVVVR
jgi:hypothetical protein